MKSTIYNLLTILSLSAVPACAFANNNNIVYNNNNQPVKEGNVIAGHVIEKGSEQGIPYAAVLIVESGEGTVTDAEGYFRFKKVPEGSIRLRCR